MTVPSDFPWQAFNVVCGGASILDIDRLELKTEAEAYQFALNYGYDLYEPTHVEQLQIIFTKAISFIEKYLCTPEVTLPEAVRKVEFSSAAKPLLLLASGVDVKSGDLNLSHRSWICVVLRVMHVIAHLQSDLRLKYIPKIKRQSIDRFQAHIQQKGEDLFLGFESDMVPLSAFHKKEGKVRDSVLIKLLHKQSATAQEIYDHLGVRFVTKNRIDALRVIKYLIDHHLVSYPNVLSIRCRNTLIDIAEFRKHFENAKGDLVKVVSSESSLSYPQIVDKQNPFSSTNFHSVQFTSRQLIRIPVLKRGGQRREMSFFFPLEIQIMDQTSFAESQTGSAGHHEYKMKQLDAVRARVLKGVSRGSLS